ncbi:hypothetical protein AB1Y20_009331 [Prymnesium parvum]|uniref:Thioredoxin domain-containing protein n=1 Tax=Prymnesium parvum TaxID=97485 RepID=A0AB34K1S8_PRYPA
MAARLTLLLAARAVGCHSALSEVVELDASNHAQIHRGVWLVAFYAPWCAHCKRLEPIYESVADHFHRASPRVAQVARLDATAHAGLATPFAVKGYPTILLLKDGNKVAQFKGKRDYPSLVRFVTRFVNGEPFEEAPAEAEEPKKARPPRVGGAAWLRAKLTSLLTEHDPLEAGLVMLGVAAVTGVCMLLALCMLSQPSPH